MIVTLLTEHHLEFLSLKGGCTGSSESTLVKMSSCWKSHATAHIFYLCSTSIRLINIYAFNNLSLMKIIASVTGVVCDRQSKKSRCN